MANKRIGYFQFAPILGNPSANRHRIHQALDGVDADLIVLPELAFTGYALTDRSQVMSLAEDPGDSPSLDFLHVLSRSSGCHFVAGFAETDGTRLFNSAALVGPRGLVALYRKIHLYGFESQLFDSGDQVPQVYDIGDLTVGMMICFDWFFPETARLLALAGADLIAHPANLVMDWCQTAMVTRCLENHLFAVTANRHGGETRKDQSLRFTGGSQITAPRGVVLKRGPVDTDHLALVDIDPAESRNKFLPSGNHLLAERRPDLYGDLLSSDTQNKS